MNANAAPNQDFTSTHEALIRAQMLDRFVDMFLGQNKRAQAGLLVSCLLVALVWFQNTRSPAALAWWGTAACLAAWRCVYSDSFVRRHNAPRSIGRIVVLLLGNGVLMALPLLAFGQFSELGRASVSIVLLATATASVVTTSGYQKVFVAFAVPMLVPLALAWAWVAWLSGSGAEWALAGLVVFFLLFLMGLATQVAAVFEESCRFRFGEQQLNRELTQALSQADEANRAKTQFLAAASHDLRQPIHSMNVLVAALSLRPLETKTREIVSLLGSVNQTLSKQLDTLLDVSKLDAGVVQAQPSDLRIDQLVRAHHGATLPLAQEQGLTLELHAQSALHVCTDPGLFMRVLSNLTDNALKFTPHGGVVRLVVEQDHQDALVQVTDSGIGIAADEQARVFREFYQVANVERDRLRGLGLGLSIVKRLSELLGLRLQLRSEPGVGTTVSLRLPLTVGTQLAPAQVPRSLGAALGLRVLVVDDEAMVRDSMRLLLTELGCIVHLADGQDAAQHMAREHHIDLMLCDWRLREGRSGLVAIHAVRDLQPAVRGVLITGDTAPDRIRDAQSAGIPILYKPVTLNDLLALMRECA
jgi:signal transduction histidine kinase